MDRLLSIVSQYFENIIDNLMTKDDLILDKAKL
jgi:hypothetical protein